MNQLTLLELLLAGFFGVACLRARVASVQGHRPRFIELLQLSGRLERLRRSRWQWFSMVLLMLVLRIQNQLPPSVEIMVAAQFVIFLALPTYKSNQRVWVKHSIG
jgi:Mg2+/citrate symporter